MTATEMNKVNMDENGVTSRTADFHLVESHGAWLLTIRGGERLLDALTDGIHDGGRTGFTVHVEPTLLPSGPFDVAVDVVADSSGNGASEVSDGPAR